MPIKILKSTAIKTVLNGGQPIVVKYATETETWRRPSLATSVQDAFAKAIEKADVPTNATTAIMAETEHPSQKDSYPHYTTVWQDNKGTHITTKHIRP